MNTKNWLLQRILDLRVAMISCLWIGLICSIFGNIPLAFLHSWVHNMHRIADLWRMRAKRDMKNWFLHTWACAKTLSLPGDDTLEKQFLGLTFSRNNVKPHKGNIFQFNEVKQLRKCGQLEPLSQQERWLLDGLFNNSRIASYCFQ